MKKEILAYIDTNKAKLQKNLNRIEFSILDNLNIL